VWGWKRSGDWLRDLTIKVRGVPLSRRKGPGPLPRLQQPPREELPPGTGGRWGGEGLPGRDALPKSSCTLSFFPSSVSSPTTIVHMG